MLKTRKVKVCCLVDTIDKSLSLNWHSMSQQAQFVIVHVGKVCHSRQYRQVGKNKLKTLVGRHYPAYTKRFNNVVYWFWFSFVLIERIQNVLKT